MSDYTVPQWMCSKVDDLRAEGRTADECRDLADLISDYAEEIDPRTLKERSDGLINDLDNGLPDLEDTIGRGCRP